MKLLIAEDEKDLAEALSVFLEKNLYTVDTVHNGADAYEYASTGAYDAIILDIMMPKLNGLQVLSRLREDGVATPVMLLTAKGQKDDRIAGFDAGADDYLTKPFAMGELLARIRSMTRRAGDYTPKKLRVGSVTLDMEQQELFHENSIRLAAKETKLMEYLMLNEGKKLSTSEILTHVWNGESTDEKIVWMYVNFLRSKLDSINADITIDGQQGGSYVLSTLAGGNIA